MATDFASAVETWFCDCFMPKHAPPTAKATASVAVFPTWDNNLHFYRGSRLLTSRGSRVRTVRCLLLLRKK
jgi:hypothetical protein